MHPVSSAVSEEDGVEQRIVLVVGGLGLLGSEVCEQLLLRGDTVVCCDELPPESLSPVPSPSMKSGGDAVNGSRSLAEKSENLRRLQEISRQNLRYVYLGKRERTALTVRAAVAAARPTDLVLLGLCGREDGGEIAYGALRQFQGKSAVVASSAAVYDTSAGGARRGGTSARTHTRPLLSESDAADDGGQNAVAASTWRVERAVAKATLTSNSTTLTVMETRVAILRFFGVFGGRPNFARHLAQRLKNRFDSPSTTIQAAPEPEDVSNLLDVDRQGAYGCADFCAVADAAEACIRTLNAFRRVPGPPGATAVNVGVGKAHRVEHVAAAAAKALAAHGLYSISSGQTINSTHLPTRSPSPKQTFKIGLLSSKSNSKSCPAGLSQASLASGDARAGFAAADVSKLRALVGWVPTNRLDTALAREVARSVERDAHLPAVTSSPPPTGPNITDDQFPNASPQQRTPHLSPQDTTKSLDTTTASRHSDNLLSLTSDGDKNRSLAALDLSSCVATSLLQVTARVHSLAPTDTAPLVSDTRPSTPDNDNTAEVDTSVFSRINQKQRFFQLNQLTSLPGPTQTSASLKKPSLKTIF